MPKELRPRIIRIPGRFDDKEFLQIANHAPCYISGEEAIIAYDCEYGLIPQEDGSKIYVLSDLLPGRVDYNHPYADTLLCAYPTVLIIDVMSNTRNYRMKTSLEDIYRYSLQVSYRDKEWLERIIEKFQPNVLLFKGRVEKVLSDAISLKDNLITVRGKSYPAYLYRDRKKYMNVILELARNPSRGKHYPFCITKEEMERLKMAGKAVSSTQYVY